MLIKIFKLAIVIFMFISSNSFASTLNGSTKNIYTRKFNSLYEQGENRYIFNGTHIISQLISYNNDVNANIYGESSLIGNLTETDGDYCSLGNATIPYNGYSEATNSYIPIQTNPYYFNIGINIYQIPIQSYTFYAGINKYTVFRTRESIDWLNDCIINLLDSNSLYSEVTSEGSNAFSFTHDYCFPDKTLKSIKIAASYRIKAESDFNDNDLISMNGMRPDTTSGSNHLYNGLYYETFEPYGSSWRLPVTNCDAPIIISFTSPIGYLSGMFQVIPEYATCELSIDSFTTTTNIINPYAGDIINIAGTISEKFGQSVVWSLKTGDKSITGSGTSVNATWDGKDASGKIVEPGIYSATLTARTSDGKCSDVKSIPITVVKACDLTANISGPGTRLAFGAGGSYTITGAYATSSTNPVNWILSLPDGSSNSGTGLPIETTWNGNITGGVLATPGSYEATLTVTSSDDSTCSDTKTLNIIVGDDPLSCGLYVTFGSSAHMASGNLSHSQSLFSARGGASPAGLTLNYNSLNSANLSLGRGWSHNYDYLLIENNDGSVLINEPNMRYKYYALVNGVYTTSPENNSILNKTNNSTFTITEKEGAKFSYANGKLVSIIDRNGNITTLTYSNDNLSTVTDPAGRVITFTYDDSNHLAAITDPLGNTYALSVGNSLTNVMQPDGSAWKYTYDANAYMLTKTDPLGNATSYTYDDKHRVVSSIDPEGKTRSIAYPHTNESVKTTTFTEKDGGVWSYSYDTQKGYLLSKTDPLEGTTAYGYDAIGNRTSTTNSDGITTSATYDGTGNMLTSTDALGQTTGYTYNNFGQVTGITDAQGDTTAYAYDTKGNLTALTDPTGASTKYVYDNKGNITIVTDPAGLVTSFTYDATGNLVTVTDSSGATSTYGYDAAGNVTSITDAKGTVTQLVYDNRNRLIKSIDPNGHATLYSYDANGNKLSDTDANGNVTRYEYNSKNQLIKTIDAMGNSTTYGYGGSSCPSCGGGNGQKLTTLTDANGNSTSYLYDQLGRLSKETDPKGNTTSYAYDARNNLTSKTDANGNTTIYSYDGNGRLLKKTYPDSTQESYTYDLKGNILTASNKDIAYNFSYDAAGRMTSSTDSNSRYLQYNYDNTGRKTKTIYPEGSVVSYSYNTAGRLATITNGGGRTYGYSYDKLGRRNKLTYPSGATTNYAYDTAGRLTNLKHKQSNGSIIASFAYTHDNVGNRLTKTESDNKINYAYDAIYRLLKAQPNRHDSTSEAYAYDAVGNRLTGPSKNDDYTYGPGNQLHTALGLAYNYDNNGNLVWKGQRHHGDNDKGEHHDHDDHHDKDNEHHANKGWTYTYDFDNRLIKAEKKHTIVTFKYDPFGRRIEKWVKEGENCRDEDAVVHTYVYEGQAIILEYETAGDGRHKKTEVTKYVHGPGIDEPLAMTRDNEVYFYHADGLGSVVTLTDKKQHVVEAYEYDSFGNLKGDIKPMQLFTYAGRIFDIETGLYDNRARYYDPMEGRFISRDPIGFSGGINLYSYVQNNAINKRDPSGLKWDLTELGSLSGALSSVISTRRGKAMYEDIECRARTYKIRESGYRPGYTSGIISINPSINLWIDAIGVSHIVPSSIERQLAHEMGHAYDESLSEMQNIITNENPVAAELGQPPRATTNIYFGR